MSSTRLADRTSYLSVPVTAIKAVRVDSRTTVVLSGQGPALVVSRLDSHDRDRPTEVDRCEVLPNAYPVHGIGVRETSRRDRTIEWVVLVWGGRSVRLVVMNASGRTDGMDWDVSVRVCRMRMLDDWVFAVRFERGMDNAVVMTAHNSVRLVSISRVESGDGHRSSGWDWTITTIKSSSQCLLYSADVHWLSSSTVLVVSGTCYGEICVWICRVKPLVDDGKTELEDRAVVELLPGHEGSVFGLSVSSPQDRADPDSNRYLILSCSDDRRVHVWPISIGKQSSKTVGTVEQELGNRHTGFEAQPDVMAASTVEPAASAWAAQSRVWLVDSVVCPSARHDPVHLVLAAGEDATVHVWDLVWTGNRDDRPRAGRMVETCAGRHHVGRNIWAFDRYFDDLARRLVVVTGGADGQIIAHRVPVDGSAMDGRPEATWSIEDIVQPDQPARPDAFRSFDITPSGHVVVVSNTGTVLVGQSISQQLDQRWDWQRVDRADWLCRYSIVRTCAGTNHVLVAGTGPTIIFITGIGSGSDAQTQHVDLFSRPDGANTSKIASLHCCAVDLGGHDQAIAVLATFSPPSSPRMVLVRPPLSGRDRLVRIASFVLDGGNSGSGPARRPIVPTAFSAVVSLDNGSDQTAETVMWFIGTRNGHTMFYHTSLDAARREDKGTVLADEHHRVGPISVSNQHQSEAVTGFLWKSSRVGSDTLGWLFSTGRGGMMVCEAVSESEPPAVVHRLRLPLGPYVEGIVELDTEPTSDDTTRRAVVVFGFKKTRFVVHDVIRSIDLFSVDCGGAHRPWALQKSTSWSLVWLQSKRLRWSDGSTVTSSQSDRSSDSLPTTNPTIVQTGIHGREIKAADIDGQLLATGSEDTDIKIFSISRHRRASRPEWDLECISTIRQHTTGLQALAWSPSCRTTSRTARDSRRYLFSTGGAAELFAWKFNPNVPIVNTGIVLAGRYSEPRGDRTDIRFTAVHISNPIEMSQVGTEMRLRVVTTTSDSHIHVLEYIDLNDGSDGRWITLHDIQYSTICLTNIISVCITDNTDRSERLFITATDGTVLIVDHDNPSTMTNRTRQTLHQSAILAFEYCDLAFGYMLTITGGDDNAIVLSLQHSTSSRQSANVVIPRSHSATIKAIRILSIDSFETDARTQLIFASAGNDQIINLWRVIITTPSLSSNIDRDVRPDQIDVRRIASRWTPIADVASLLFVRSDGNDEPTDSSRLDVLVAGVGIEIVTFDQVE